MQQLPGSRGQVRWQGNAKVTNIQEAKQLGSQTFSSSRARTSACAMPMGWVDSLLDKY